MISADLVDFFGKVEASRPLFSPLQRARNQIDCFVFHQLVDDRPDIVLNTSVD